MIKKPHDAATLQHVIKLVEGFANTADAGGAMEEQKLSPEALQHLRDLKADLEPHQRYVLVCEEVAAVMDALLHQLVQLQREAPPPDDQTPVINTAPPLVAFRDDSIEIAQEAFEEADKTDPDARIRVIDDGSKMISLVYGDKSPVLHPASVRVIEPPKLDPNQYRRTVMIPNAPTVDAPPTQRLRGLRGAWAAFVCWLVSS